MFKNKYIEIERKVLLGIIAVAKNLGKNNSALRENNEMNQEANQIFLSLAEMITTFDPTIQDIFIELKIVNFTTWTYNI